MQLKCDREVFMKFTKNFFFAGLILFISMLSGCASLQKDIVMSTDVFIQDEDILSIEKRFIAFDARNILTGEVATNPNIYLDAEKFEKEIDNSIKTSGLNKNLNARLYALDGLTCLLQGKKVKAKTCYQKSMEESKGDSYTVILGYRLGLIESLTDENIISGSNQSALLTLEEGLQNYQKGEYSNCVAKLDSAFINLPEFYQSEYNEIRANAWNLRSNIEVTENAKVLSILNKNEITIGEMLVITQETSDLINIINGGNKYSENELFNRIKKAGLLDSCSSVGNAGKKVEIKRNQIVNRTICARFLWNSYCLKKNYTYQKTQSSKKFREQIGYSPITDIKLINEDFDAIVGVIEHEIMDLEDGINFYPDEKVTAPDFNSYVQRIK